MTLTEFIASARITMTAATAETNPAMDSDTAMDHWRCVLKAGKSRLTVPFSMGKGHNGSKPDLAGVLDCLASDASGIENATGFDDWCADYGYDTDSRKAEKTYRACERSAKKLKAFLGDSAYETLLWKTERE